MLELRTFGGLAIKENGVPLSGAAVQRKTLALLALLAAAGRKGVSRDKLVAYLWPERDTDRARPLLTHACSPPRHGLADPELLRGGVVTVGEPRLFEEVAGTIGIALGP